MKSKCKFCSEDGSPISRKGAEERDIMRECMVVDRVAKHITVSYPSVLVDNCKGIFINTFEGFVNSRVSIGRIHLNNLLLKQPKF